MRVAILAAALAAIFAAGSANADVVISKQPTKHMSCVAGVCSPTGANAVLNATDLTTMLASGDVKVTTGSGATNIAVSDTVSWATTSRLTLDANQSVTIEKPVMVTGTGAVTITTNDGGTGGDLIFNGKGNVTFWDLTSSLIINGNSYTLIGDISTLATDIASNPSGFYALANDYHARHAYGHAPIQDGFDGTFEGLGHVIYKLTINLSKGYGGLFSFVRGAVRDLGLSDVNLTGSGDFTGALVGELDGLVGAPASITGCYATGTISVNGRYHIGGLVGANAGGSTISRSFAAVNVTALNADNAGGLAGLTDGSSIVESFATGAVTGGEKAKVGGLTGSMQLFAAVINSYATGTVSGGLSAHVGGLIGDTDTSGAATSYSTSEIIGGKDNTTGGFVGVKSGTFSSDYWDIDTSGEDHGAGRCNKECRIEIVGLTTEQLTSELPVGFDPTVWGQAPNINGGYPYLVNNPPPE